MPAPTVSSQINNTFLAAGGSGTRDMHRHLAGASSFSVVAAGALDISGVTQATYRVAGTGSGNHVDLTLPVGNWKGRNLLGSNGSSTNGVNRVAVFWGVALTNAGSETAGAFYTPANGLHTIAMYFNASTITLNDVKSLWEKATASNNGGGLAGKAVVTGDGTVSPNISNGQHLAQSTGGSGDASIAGGLLTLTAPPEERDPISVTVRASNADGHTDMSFSVRTVSGTVLTGTIAAGQRPASSTGSIGDWFHDGTEAWRKLDNGVWNSGTTVGTGSGVRIRFSESGNSAGRNGNYALINSNNPSAIPAELMETVVNQEAGNVSLRGTAVSGDITMRVGFGFTNYGGTNPHWGAAEHPGGVQVRIKDAQGNYGALQSRLRGGMGGKSKVRRTAYDQQYRRALHRQGHGRGRDGEHPRVRYGIDIRIQISFHEHGRPGLVHQCHGRSRPCFGDTGSRLRRFPRQRRRCRNNERMDTVQSGRNRCRHMVAGVFARHAADPFRTECFLAGGRAGASRVRADPCAQRGELGIPVQSRGRNLAGRQHRRRFDSFHGHNRIDQRNRIRSKGATASFRRCDLEHEIGMEHGCQRNPPAPGTGHAKSPSVRHSSGRQAVDDQQANPAGCWHYFLATRNDASRRKQQSSSQWNERNSFRPRSGRGLFHFHRMDTATGLQKIRQKRLRDLASLRCFLGNPEPVAPYRKQSGQRDGAGGSACKNAGIRQRDFRIRLFLVKRTVWSSHIQCREDRRQKSHSYFFLRRCCGLRCRRQHRRKRHGRRIRRHGSIVGRHVVRSRHNGNGTELSFFDIAATANELRGSVHQDVRCRGCRTSDADVLLDVHSFDFHRGSPATSVLPTGVSFNSATRVLTFSSTAAPSASGTYTWTAAVRGETSATQTLSSDDHRGGASGGSRLRSQSAFH